MFFFFFPHLFSAPDVALVESLPTQTESTTIQGMLESFLFYVFLYWLSLSELTEVEVYPGDARLLSSCCVTFFFN